MPRKRQVEYGILNFVAQPHPKGIYERLLTDAAGNGVSFMGNDFVAISKPRRVEDGIFRGEIIIWTRIDPNSPAIDIENLEQKALSETDFEIPDDVGINGRVFAYILRTDIHVIVHETRNELNKRLSPKRAVKMFRALLSPDRVNVPDTEVHITAIPEENVLEKILSIYRLDHLTIDLTAPNADEHGKKAQQIIDRLQSQNIGRDTRNLRRMPKTPGIELDEESMTYAEVAATNGKVSASGRLEDGSRFEGSTEEHPKLITLVVESSVSAAVAAVRAAKEYVGFDRQG